MATNITLKTWEGELNTDLHDALIRDTLVQMNGIFKGCGISYTSGNTIHISAGYGMIKGRLFEVYDHDLSVALPSSGTYKGRVYVHMDLGNADEPVTLAVITATTLPALETDEDVNFDQGVYEMELHTFDVTALDIENIETTVPNIDGVLKRLGYADALEAPEMQDCVTSFPANGTIVNTYAGGLSVITSFPANGTIVETLKIGTTTLYTKTTSFPANGNINVTIE